MRFTKASGLLLGALWFALGCQKEQHEQSVEPVASVDKTAGIDPALAKAVAAASAAVPRGPKQRAPGEPPAGGIFEAGEADKEITRGAPPKLTLGGTGSEPRVALGAARPKPGWKTQGMIEISVQGDPQQQAIPIDLAVSVEALKPKAAPADAGVAEPVTMSVKVQGAKLGITGVPQDLEARFAKLKGTKVEYQLAPDGAGSGFKAEVPGGAGNPDLADKVRQLVDTLAFVTLPFPSEPVGAGAYWMVTSREGVFGLDLVTYRLVKVESVTGDLVSLSVGTKRYATSNHFEMEGLPPDAPHELGEFECRSDGKLLFKADSAFPASGDVQAALGASLIIPGPQQQRANLTIQSRVTLDFGKR
jgi:hypothetical protein